MPAADRRSRNAPRSLGHFGDAEFIRRLDGKVGWIRVNDRAARRVE